MTGMRFQRILVSTVLLGLAVRLDASPILLVKGTTSNTDPRERAYAAKLTGKMSSWLDRIGIAHDVVDDSSIANGIPADTRVAILGYNPYPDPVEVRGLKAFLARGGKLIVFYSADNELAAAMGFTLGTHNPGGESAPWRAFRFLPTAPPHLPSRVLQHSRHTRPAYPNRKDAAVIAQWEDAAGKPLKEPAWVASDSGFWMTHVLLDDGDMFNKRLMLLGLIGACDPAVWKPAAEYCLSDAARLGRFASFEEAVAAARAMGDGAAREAVAAKLRKASGLYSELQAQLAANGVAAVVRRSEELRLCLYEGFGLAQRPRANEFRGVWDHSGVGLYPGDWPRTAALLANNGITAVFCNVMWTGAAHYKSALVPQSPVMQAHGDQLAAAITAAHGSGLELHAWKVCWKLDRAPPDMIENLRKQKRLQVTDKGDVLNWLCPSHPDNLRLEKDAIREVVRAYDIDGIHLDYIRYRDSHVCYCDGCRKRLAAYLGRPLHHWPPLKHELLLKKQVRDWRVSRITALVRDIAVATRRVKPNVRISAAVFGRYPLCADSIGQDWGAWLEEGHVDFVCPMNYSEDRMAVQTLVNDQMKLPGARNRLFPGLGVTAAESRLDPLQVIEQISDLRTAGASGFVLFDLNPILADDILPILRLGITAP